MLDLICHSQGHGHEEPQKIWLTFSYLPLLDLELITFEVGVIAGGDWHELRFGFGQQRWNQDFVYSGENDFNHPDPIFLGEFLDGCHHTFKPVATSFIGVLDLRKDESFGIVLLDQLGEYGFPLAGNVSTLHFRADVTYKGADTLCRRKYGDARMICAWIHRHDGVFIIPGAKQTDKSDDFSVSVMEGFREEFRDACTVSVNLQLWV